MDKRPTFQTRAEPLGPMAKCKHCGVLSLAEAMACEEGDCTIINWRVPLKAGKEQE